MMRLLSSRNASNECRNADGRATERVRTARGRPFSPAAPPGLRIYAIGDIHGRSDLLDALHERIARDMAERDMAERGMAERGMAEPPADCRLVYLGDYVDRGPDSAGVLERLTNAPAPGGAPRILLKGNHEDILLKFLEGRFPGMSWRDLGGLETLCSYGADARAILAKEGFSGLSRALAQSLPGHHLAMLRALKTSAVLGDYFFCHAGVRPGVPLDRQQEEDLLWIRQEFLTSTSGFGKVVVHGHSPAYSPEFLPNRIGIDTGAYATGHLTCLVLEGTERRILAT